MTQPGWGTDGPTQNLLYPASHGTAQRSAVLDPTSVWNAREHGALQITRSPAKHPEPKSPHWSSGKWPACVCVYPSSSYPFSLTFLEVPGTEGKLQAGRQTSQERAEAAVHRENFFWEEATALPIYLSRSAPHPCDSPHHLG